MTKTDTDFATDVVAPESGPPEGEPIMFVSRTVWSVLLRKIAPQPVPAHGFLKATFDGLGRHYARVVAPIPVEDARTR